VTRVRVLALIIFSALALAEAQTVDVRYFQAPEARTRTDLVQQSPLLRSQMYSRAEFAELPGFAVPLAASSPSWKDDGEPVLAANLERSASVSELSKFLAADAVATLAMPSAMAANDSRSAEPATGSPRAISERRGRWGGERWLPAITEAFGFTVVQHVFRIAREEKTRDKLSGKFWPDYWDSVNGLHTWDDGGKFFTNYISHPLQGGIYGYIWVTNNPTDKLIPFGGRREYWIGRLKSFWWVAAWEAQWKLGPLSEASIGNVGQRPGTLGAVDLVVTPVFGTGLMIGEDAIDRYFTKPLEARVHNRNLVILTRVFTSPSRTAANVFTFHWPWYRADRPEAIRH
jgi:hypothetical protein